MRRLLVSLAFVLLAPLQAQAALRFGDCFEYGCDTGSSSCTMDALFYDGIVGTMELYEDPANAIREKFCSHQSGISRFDSCENNNDCATENLSCQSDSDCSFGSTCQSNVCLGICAEEYNNDFVLRINSSDELWPTLILPKQVYGFQDGCVLRLERVGVPPLNSLPECSSNSDCVSGWACNTGTDRNFECHAAADTKYRIKTYLDDPTTKRCVSSLNNGTICTDTDDCLEAQEGEASCAVFPLATSPEYEEGDIVQLVVCQDNSAGTIYETSCSFFEGGFQRGGKTLAMGQCWPNPASCPGDPSSVPVGAGADNFACASNSDCYSNGGACTCAGVENDAVNEVRVGSLNEYLKVKETYIDTAGYGESCVGLVLIVTSTGNGMPGGNWTYYIDDIVIGDDVDDSDYFKSMACHDKAIDTVTIAGGNTCVAGSEPNSLCTVNSDCAGGGTCENGGTWPTETGCLSGGNDTCVDDTNDGTAGPGHDDLSTRLVTNNDAKGVVDLFGLESLTTPTNTDAYLQDKECTTGDDIGDSCSSNGDCSGGGVCTDIYPVIGITGAALVGDEGTSPSGAQTVVVNLDAFPELNSTASVDGLSPLTATNLTKPGFGFFYNTYAKLALADLRVQADATGGIGSQIYMTVGLGQAFLKMRNPTSPGVAPDINGDGIRRLVLAGDSQFNDMAPYVAQNFYDYDSVFDCTQGATTSWDIAQDIENILDGVEGGRMGCEVLRGSVGNADLLIVSTGGNDIHMNAQGAWDKNYPYGRCRGGDNHGLASVCYQHSGYKTGTNAITYCLNKTNNSGNNWLSSTNTESECRACSTNTDCGTNITCANNGDCAGGSTCIGLQCSAPCGHCVDPDTGLPDSSSSQTCNTNSDCTAVAEEDTCIRECSQYVGSGSNFWYDIPARGWLHSGCVDDPLCPDGISYGLLSTAVTESAYARILDVVQSRTGSKEVEAIFVTQAINSCGGTTFFTKHSNRLDLGNKIAMNIFEGHGEHWLDNDKRIEWLCDGGEFNCFRSEAHYSGAGLETEGSCTGTQKGVTTFLEGLRVFLEGTASNDGTCSGGACTKGAVGLGCTTNDDCHTYYRAP